MWYLKTYRLIPGSGILGELSRVAQIRQSTARPSPESYILHKTGIVIQLATVYHNIFRNQPSPLSCCSSKSPEAPPTLTTTFEDRTTSEPYTIEQHFHKSILIIGSHDHGYNDHHSHSRDAKPEAAPVQATCNVSLRSMCIPSGQSHSTFIEPRYAPCHLYFDGQALGSGAS